MIVGPDGRPLRPGPAAELRERRARGSIVGLRRAAAARAVTPVLDPPLLARLLRSVARGEWTPDWWELAEELEERDLHYRGVMQQRRLAVEAAPREVVAADDSAASAALADEVRERLVATAAWRDLVGHLLDALGKGVALVEIVWRRAGGRWEPVGYHRVPQRWIAWDRADPSVPLLVSDDAARTAPTLRTGVPAEPLAIGAGKWAMHVHRGKSGLPQRGGLAYAVAAMFLLKSLAMRDWWAYGETYGLPTRVGRYDRNASAEDIETLRAAVAYVARDFGAVIPDSMRIDIETPGLTGGRPGEFFREQVALADAQVSKAVVGQTMTADDGSSRAQAQVHADVRADLVADDSVQLCATLTAQVVAPYCSLNHGSPPAAGWPRIEPSAPPTDLDPVLRAMALGLEVPAAWLRERLGVPEPGRGADVVRAPGGPAPNAGGGSPEPQAALDPTGAEWRRAGVDAIRPAIEAARGARGGEDLLLRLADAPAARGLGRMLDDRLFRTRVDADGGG